MFDEMPNSNSPNFSGVRKRKWGEYVAEKWDPITRKLVWSGTFNTAEEASEAYLAKQREFAYARHMFDEMPSSNSTNKIASAAAAAERSKGYTSNTAEEASEAYLVKQREFASALHMFDEMPSSNSTNKIAAASAAAAERCKGYAFNAAEEASDAYLVKRCQFVSAHHMYDEMPSSNLTNKTAATAAVAAPSPSERTKVDNGKTLLIKEISFRDKSPLLGAEWHNMGRLKKNDPFKKRKVCKGFNSNMHESKKPVKVMNVESDRCTTTKRGRKAKTGLLGTRSLKNGKYGAEIRDPVKHKPVWLGTFDTVEEASQAYLSKKCEFDVLSQGNKENEPKKCDQIRPESSVGASLSSPCRNKKMDSSKTTRIVGVHKNKWGKYTSEIIDPISKKKIWLGTFSMYEEAMKAYQSKKLEFRGLVKPKKKCSKKRHSTSREKQVGKEKFVNVKQSSVNGERFQPKSAAEEMLHANQYVKLPVQGSEVAELQSKMPVDFSIPEKQRYVNGERFQPKSAAEEMLHANQYMKLPVQGSKEAELQSKMPVDFSILEKQGYVNGERFQLKSAAEEMLHAIQYMKIDVQGPKEAKLQSKMPVDFSTLEEQGGQEDADMWMGQWVQLPDGREVKISLELGLPIIDNYGSLLDSEGKRGEINRRDNNQQLDYGLVLGTSRD